MEVAASGDVGVVEVAEVVWLTVEGCRADVAGVGAVPLGGDSERRCRGVAGVKFYRDAVENRGGELVTRFARTKGMEPHGGENIPCRHLSDILVAA